MFQLASLFILTLFHYLALTYLFIPKDVARWMLAGTAASTNRTYTGSQRAYLDFCAAHHRQPLPASEALLMEYTVFLHRNGRQASTCASHLSAIRHLHLINNCSDPLLGADRLALVKRGIATCKKPLPLRAPITNEVLNSFLAILDLSVFEDALVFAISCLGVFGFLRVSEYLAPGLSFDPSSILTPADISWFPGRIELLIKSSKGDRLRQGVRISLGRSSSAVCPMKALLGYLMHRSRIVPPPDLATSPLFLSQDGLPVLKPWFAARLADLGKRVGVQGEVKPHSLRIGAATSAWRAGYSDSQIQALGRWRSDSFLRYLRPCAKDMARLSSRLAPL